MTLELYRRRAFGEKVQGSTALWRAFDKAVRTRPPVIAADAGLMQIQWREECGVEVRRGCAARARQTTAGA